MPKAQIIAIGSELLLGETADTNTFYLLQEFRKNGIDIYKTIMIGDNPQRIAETIRIAMTEADIVITTGGLGPTIDDPAREAAALAFNTHLIYSEALWNEISSHFVRMGSVPSENNRRQAMLPQNASAISNPSGTAPAFYIEESKKIYFAIPGVPREMKFLWQTSVLPFLKQKYDLIDIIEMRTLHAFGLGESVIDEMIGDLETSVNPTLGLCAKMGQIDLRITAKASSSATAFQMINQFEQKIRIVLGNVIYGVDEETLAEVTRKIISEKALKIKIFHNGTVHHIFDWLPDAENLNPQNHCEKENSIQPSENEIIILSQINPAENGFLSVKGKCLTPLSTIEFSRNYNALTFSEITAERFILNQIRLSCLQFNA